MLHFWVVASPWPPLSRYITISCPASCVSSRLVSVPQTPARHPTAHHEKPGSVFAHYFLGTRQPTHSTLQNVSKTILIPIDYRSVRPHTKKNDVAFWIGHRSGVSINRQIQICRVRVTGRDSCPEPPSRHSAWPGPVIAAFQS